MKQHLLALLLVAAALAPSAFGQATDGNVIGSVLDPTGAVVANATVELMNVATGVKSTVVTDASGSYRFGNVPLGTYSITVSATGSPPHP